MCLPGGALSCAALPLHAVQAQLEVRASLALFENVRASMVLSDLGNKPELNEAAAPSPKGAATKGAGWSAQPSAAAAPVAAPSALPRSARSSREDVAAAAPQAGGSNVAVAAPYEAPAAAEDNTAAQYGALGQGLQLPTCAVNNFAPVL